MALKAEVKSTDLMIWNWVIDHLGKHKQVTAHDILDQSQCDMAKVAWFKGIPLDESVLLKCTEFIGDKIELNSETTLTFRHGKMWLSVNFYPVELPIKYLHSLQNFVNGFGQHLTFKP